MKNNYLRQFSAILSPILRDCHGCLKIPSKKPTYSNEKTFFIFLNYFISFHRIPCYFKTTLFLPSLKYLFKAFRPVLISFLQKRQEKIATLLKVCVDGSLRGVPSENLKISWLGTNSGVQK